MKGNDQVIEALNAGLTIELTAINLYFIPVSYTHLTLPTKA